MTFRLPLFPLEVVLFPGALLPLHIFEARYRRLLADIQDSTAMFGIALPGIAHEAPAIGAVGCVAEVRGVQQFPDGRSNIVVQGATRFLVTRYLDESAPYLIAMVEGFDDRDGTEPASELAERLVRALARYLPVHNELAGREPDSTPLPTDPVELSFRAAASLDCDVADRQAMLEMRSTSERIARLLDLLPGLTEAAEAGLRQRHRAQGNGKGHWHGAAS